MVSLFKFSNSFLYTVSAVSAKSESVMSFELENELDMK